MPMKAIFVSRQQGLQIVDLPKPEIQQDTDVLIRITSASICSSDLEIAAGTHPFAKYPMILGHEFGGIVEAVGTAVSGVHVGDLVAVDPVTSCGHCHSCLRGKPNICLNLATMGVHRNGGFAEYAVVPSENVYVFHRGAIDPGIVGLAEPYSIGVQINHRAAVQKGDNVLILGSGPIGICAMQEAKYRGAHVVMTDLIPERLNLASRMGADLTLNAAKEDIPARILEQFSGNLADVVINTVGTPATLSQSVEMAAFGGTIVNISIDNRPATISQAEITKKELTIVGSRLNNRHFTHVVKNIEDRYFQPELLKTHTFHFTDIQKGLDLIVRHPEQVEKITLRFD